jgi:hypothetical protein
LPAFDFRKKWPHTLSLIPGSKHVVRKNLVDSNKVKYAGYKTRLQEALTEILNLSSTSVANS